MNDLAQSAAAEWATLLNAALLGTDRRPLAPASPGWESVVAAPDQAIELLNRAAAVATARRAGVQPQEAPLLAAPAPLDPRPVCSAGAAELLVLMLGGQHEALLPEWISLCLHAGLRVPHHLIPKLLLRGRRNPAFDHAVRPVLGPRAAWLAQAMPELGVGAAPKPLPAKSTPFLPPAPPPDSGAVVTAISGAFAERQATWAAAPQLRIAVASLHPEWLAALILELNRAAFNPVTERTRVDLLGLARVRREMVAALQPAAVADVADAAEAAHDPLAADTRTRVRLAP